MQQIAIVTNSRRAAVGTFLNHNLQNIFQETVAVRNYYFDELTPGDRIDAAIVLVVLKAKALEVQQYVAEPQRIVVMNRTIKASEVYKIFAIPQDTKVLVVNDNAETTLETVALFYQIGIRHLEFIPYEAGGAYPDVKIAITPGERHLVPAHIEAVIDLDHRVVDISTVLNIIHRLGIDDPAVSQRLIRYTETTVALDAGVKEQYQELFRKHAELDTVLNVSHEGILFLHTDGSIRICNQSLQAMLGLSADACNGKASDILPQPVLALLDKAELKDELLEYQGRSMLVNRQDVSCWGEKAGTYIAFQEVTYIRQLERNLRRRLREKGLVSRYAFSDIRTQSPKMQQCLAMARKIADSDLTVLIVGESGTGKELLAQSIHNASKRQIQPFIAVNCAAVPENLLESELFGYDGGAFTGALKEGKAGLLEQANHGTLFLDEIGDMPYALQAKLLRVLQERQFMRIGSQRVITVDIRIIAATHHDLREKMRQGEFREDLYYRLNVLPLLVPPLRERQEDLFFLLDHFLTQQGAGDLTFSSSAREVLRSYAWPGNIRELGSVACYLSFVGEQMITAEALPYYLQEEEESFQWEAERLDQRCGLAKSKALLAILAEASESGNGIGRKQLGEILQQRHQALSEGEVRGLLQLLQTWGLVRAGVGRQGSSLTQRGLKMYNWLLNR